MDWLKRGRGNILCFAAACKKEGVLILAGDQNYAGSRADQDPAKLLIIIVRIVQHSGRI
jgi:hypothetical protein